MGIFWKLVLVEPAPVVWAKRAGGKKDAANKRKKTMERQRFIRWEEWKSVTIYILGRNPGLITDD
jgi:hypothetical protein